MNQRLDDIEVRMAWLERANAQLSDEVNRQRLEIESLQARLATLTQRLEAAQSQPTAYTPEEEKPPHY